MMEITNDILRRYRREMRKIVDHGGLSCPVVPPSHSSGAPKDQRAPTQPVKAPLAEDA